MFSPHENRPPTTLVDTLLSFEHVGFNWRQVGRLAYFGIVYDRIVEVDGIPRAAWTRVPGSPGDKMAQFVIQGAATIEDDVLFREAILNYPKDVVRRNWPDLFDTLDNRGDL